MARLERRDDAFEAAELVEGGKRLVVGQDDFGAIGAGGLGYIAIYYGYNRSATDVTIIATLCILVLVFIIQFVGDFLTKKLSHK